MQDHEPDSRPAEPGGTPAGTSRAPEGPGGIAWGSASYGGAPRSSHLDSPDPASGPAAGLATGTPIDVRPYRPGAYEVDEDRLAHLDEAYWGDGTDDDGPAREGSPAAGHRRSAVREVLETVVLALLIFVSVQGVVQNFRVEGSSMDPNLQNNERLLVNRAIFFQLDLEAVHKFLPFIDPGDHPRRFLFRGPQRGDIIVFKYPKDPSRDFIKRVIGLPGDTVEVRRGRVRINGEEVQEAYIQFKASYNYPATTVAPGEYFVLGDNRSNSSDSHLWGFVPEQNLIGLAWLSYWPVDSAGLAPNLSLDVPSSGD